MYMGILFIEVHNERRDVLLAILFTDESIGILCPLLNFRLSDDPAVVRSLLEIHILLSKGKLPHQLAGAAEDNVNYRPVLGLHQSFVRVLNTPLTETFSHPVRNAPAFVHRTHLAVYYLKVQMFPCRVVVAFLHGIFRRLLTAVTQMFVALGGGDAFGDLNVENLFCICHTVSSVALDNLSCPSLLPAWTSLPMTPIIGVLGSPSLCLVADGQARMPVINGRTATPAEGRIIRGYTMGFDSPHLRISPGLSPQPTGTGREGRQGAADGRRRGRCPFLSLSSEFALQGSLTGQ